MQPPAPKRILIIEDEAALAAVLHDYLQQAGMETKIIAEGHGAAAEILSGHHDLVLLDLMLPGKDGLVICREVRQSSDIPIIMLTARVEEIDRLLGLELGADDYLCKPYSPREVIARIKTIFRRIDRPATAVVPGRRLVMDAERWTATLELTTREFRLLEALHARPGRVFSRAQLLDQTFPDDADVIDRTIDSHVKNIRSKIKNMSGWELIRSVYGVGYAFDE